VSAVAPITEIPVADNASIGLELPTITDEYMRARLTQARSYTLLILKKTPKYSRPAADPIIWEHGRRNMALQRSGLMPIVCPVRDDSDLAGICIFTVSPERAGKILSEDPGVKAGIFTLDVHPVGGFPGSTLPTESQVEAENQMPHERDWER
jgi:hypothetical protein